MAPCGWRWHTWRRGRELVAAGTQLGAVYELRYRLERERLFLEVVGERSRDVELGDADFFDLGWSPLFNSLPVMRDRLLEEGPPRLYTMCWVDVPSLQVSRSDQRYEPLGTVSPVSRQATSVPRSDLTTQDSCSTTRESPRGSKGATGAAACERLQPNSIDPGASGRTSKDFRLDNMD